MFIVLYKWRIKPGLERQFTENWSALTQYFLESCGSLGSRLHVGDDGLYYGYAQWPDAAARDNARLDVGLEHARLHMKEAIEESFPETVLESIDDYLRLPTLTE